MDSNIPTHMVPTHCQIQTAHGTPKHGPQFQGGVSCRQAGDVNIKIVFFAVLTCQEFQSAIYSAYEILDDRAVLSGATYHSFAHVSTTYRLLQTCATKLENSALPCSCSSSCLHRFYQLNSFERFRAKGQFSYGEALSVLAPRLSSGVAHLVNISGLICQFCTAKSQHPRNRSARTICKRSETLPV